MIVCKVIVAICPSLYPDDVRVIEAKLYQINYLIYLISLFSQLLSYDQNFMSHQVVDEDIYLISQNHNNIENVTK